MHDTDVRPSLDARCLGCGAKADSVKWAALGSNYENGHVISGSMPDVCGPFLLTADYDLYPTKSVYRQTRFLREAEQRFMAVLDAAKAGAS